MDLQEYQEFTKTTAIYPSEKALEYCTLGLTSEAGEVAGKIKKLIRDGVKSQEDFEKDITAELGDVLWYVSEMCNSLGLSLTEVLEHNVEKLSKRKNNGTITGSGDNR